MRGAGNRSSFFGKKQRVGIRKQAGTTKNYIRVQEKIQKSRLTV